MDTDYSRSGNPQFRSQSMKQGYLFGLGMAMAMAKTDRIEKEAEAQYDKGTDDEEYSAKRLRLARLVENKVYAEVQNAE